MDFKFHVPRSVESVMVTGVGTGVDTITELVGAGVAGWTDGILVHPAIMTTRITQAMLHAVITFILSLLPIPFSNFP
jgi:hypothetical protein